MSSWEISAQPEQLKNIKQLLKQRVTWSICLHVQDAEIPQSQYPHVAPD